jgi:hypothetical protein
LKHRVSRPTPIVRKLVSAATFVSWPLAACGGGSTAPASSPAETVVVDTPVLASASPAVAVDVEADAPDTGVSPRKATPAPEVPPVEAVRELLGIAECDEYFRTMDRCIAAMDSEIRSSIEQAMQVTWDAWKQVSVSPARSELAGACKGALEAVRGIPQCQ